MLGFLRSPKFWNDGNSVVVKVLDPVSRLYSFVSNVRLNSVTPVKADVPVVCIGNVVLGGAGKTPTVELVCNLLREKYKSPQILTAGYGGYLKNVVRVDTNLHSYLQVGDEALLSANVAPTWVGRNRVNSAKAAVACGADVLIMDDGFQNNSIEKDLKILVIDSRQVFGNEHLFPAGPLRELPESGIAKSDLALIIGEKNEALESRIKAMKSTIPIFRAKMEITDSVPVENNRVVGFCGLGYPLKFKQTLVECGYEVLDFVSFADHHPYTITEIQKLSNGAKSVNATLVTTMKDFVKIPAVFRNDVSVVKIKLVPENEDFKKALLEKL
ncbi:MAG: tetraacyldisaccharide 4'-kinase [Alphaproteobacteria bacterium]|nr:tetraacyldisaccharide 4'-kinase [Alphaproteobacteria bacterium]